jgi:hypothetical protein
MLDYRQYAGYHRLRLIAKDISEDLIKNFGGKIITKGGLRNKYNLTNCASVDIIRCLVIDHGFVEVSRQKLRIPLDPSTPN